MAPHPTAHEAPVRPGGTYRILTFDERRRLSGLLSRLDQVLTGGAGGRRGFLDQNGLVSLAVALPLAETAEIFAGELIALVESEDKLLSDPPGFHPLAAVCAGVLRLEDGPRDDRPFLAGLMLKYVLIEDETYLATLAAEFGLPDAVTPWRTARRVVPPVGTRYYAAPPAGLDPLPFTLRTAIGNFLSNYLGTPEHPVPFGGRATDLARLEVWRTGSTKRCLLLATPAGRGKSALLVRWADALSRPDAVDAPAVIFVPVSSRFGTNRPELIFPCITVQLAELLGEEMPVNWGNVPPGFWQNLMGEYLRRPLPDGRPLLLILDGLDEAAWEIGPDLLPHDLPPTTRVVVSARFWAGDAPGFGPWLGRLGWERLDLAEAWSLDTLSRAGVREALVGMGRPLDEVADRETVIDRLYALTRGDPLLVELYVDWLFARGATAARLSLEELDAIQPGYEGFFNHWWAAQEKLWRQAGDDDPLARQAVRALLGILATALGPLSDADVITLLPHETQPGRITVRRALEPLRRFVIGDGAAAGYAFAHPRLGDYFREQFFDESEVRAWRRAFVDWARRALEERRVAGDSAALPPYLLQYAARHLALAGEPPESFIDLLLTKEWWRDWHRLSGTYTGFLRDVDAVLAQLTAADWAAIARGEPATYLGFEIQCILCHASVNALSANMPIDLLIALRRFGGWTDEQVLAYARQKRDAGERAHALIDIAPWLSPSRRPEAYQVALLAARALKKDWQRIEMLLTLAPYLPDTEREAILREALRASGTMMDEEQRARLLSALTLHFSTKEMEAPLLEVLQKAVTLVDEGRRASILEFLAPHLPNEVYITAHEALADERRRAQVISIVAPYLPEVEQESALREAFQLTGSLIDSRRRARVLFVLAPHLPESVFVAAQALEDDWWRARVLSAVAPYLPNAEREVALRETLRVAGALTDEGRTARILGALGPHFPEVVYEVVSLISDVTWRAGVLIALAPYLPEVKRELALQEALRSAGMLMDRGRQALVLSAVAPHLPSLVFEAVTTFTSEWWRADVLNALAPHLPELVYDTAMKLKDEGRRTRVLSALAPHLPAAVYEAARNIEDESRQVDVLIALAPSLPQAVYDAARMLKDLGWQGVVLSTLAPYLPAEERREVLQEALQASEILADEGRRVWILTLLAPYLPEKVYEAAMKSADEQRRSRLLSALAPHLPEAVRVAVGTLVDDTWRVRVLSALAPHFQEADREVILREAWRTCETLQGDWRQARALRTLAPLLPGPVYKAAGVLTDETWQVDVLIALAAHLPQAVIDAAGALVDEGERVRVFNALADYLSALPQPTLYPQWKAIADNLKQLERWQTLASLAQLTPIINTLGGDTALSQTLHAVQTVATWWP